MKNFTKNTTNKIENVGGFSTALENRRKKMKKTIFVITIILIVTFVIQLISATNNCTSQLRNREIHVTERTGEIFIEKSEIPIDRINR